LVCWVAIDHFTKPDPGFRHVDQHDEILINPSFKKKSLINFECEAKRATIIHIRQRWSPPM
jgi:hypothetical protein